MGSEMCIRDSSCEVTECLPPLFEPELPLDRGGFVVDGAEIHRESPQRLTGGGSWLPGQMAGDVHL